jgi:hypothetical protein
VALAVAGGLGGCGGKPDAERSDGHIVTAGKLSVLDLEIGDCFVPPDDLGTELVDVEGVPCSEPHQHEVFAVAAWTDGELRPDDRDFGVFADTRCLAAFRDYTGVDYLESPLVLTYLLPSIRSWNEVGDREVVCVARSPEELERSVAGAGAA